MESNTNLIVDRKQKKHEMVCLSHFSVKTRILSLLFLCFCVCFFSFKEACFMISFTNTIQLLCISFRIENFDFLIKEISTLSGSSREETTGHEK